MRVLIDSNVILELVLQREEVDVARQLPYIHYRQVPS